MRAIKLQLNAHLAKKKPKCSQQAAFGCVCVFVSGKCRGPTGHGPHGPPQCGARSITGQPAAKSPRATGHTDHRRAGRGPKRANRKPFHHGPARRPEFGPTYTIQCVYATATRSSARANIVISAYDRDVQQMICWRLRCDITVVLAGTVGFAARFHCFCFARAAGIRGRKAIPAVL